jgi:trigger factor
VQVTTERQENCIVKLTIEVDESSANNYMQRAARALSRQYRLPGFRPGKAPYNVVVQRLGIESVQAQVVEQFGDEIFEQGLKESELEPVATASLDDVSWDPSLALHLTVPVGPEVNLGAYQDIRIPFHVPEVTDEDLEAALARLQQQQAERQAAERPAELGDQVVADITALVEDETVLENTGREIILDAESPYPVPGFAQAVVGMQVDETREFTLAYPEDHYNKDIAGKEGHFEVRVSEIRAEVLPELDDEFAMSVGDYEDLADLKVKLRQSLQEEAENAAEQTFEEELWQALLETAEIEYPEVYVDRETERMQSQFSGTLQRQGLDMETFFQLTNSSEEKWRAEIRPQAIEQMKRRLILGEIAKTLELTVDADEIQAEIEETLEPLGDQADSMRELLESENGRLSIEDGLLREKAMEHLKTLTRVEAEETEPGVKEAAEEPVQADVEGPEAATESEPPAETQVSDAETEPEAPKAEEGAEDEAEDAAVSAVATAEIKDDTAQEIEQDAEPEPKAQAED